jgi:hypothetical protein
MFPFAVFVAFHVLPLEHGKGKEEWQVSHHPDADGTFPLLSLGLST